MLEVLLEDERRREVDGCDQGGEEEARFDAARFLTVARAR